MYPTDTVPSRRIDGIKNSIQYWKANKDLDSRTVSEIITRLENDLKSIASDK